MKKLIVLIFALVLVGATSCDKSYQLKKQIKTEVNKNAKENGGKVKFNTLEIIRLYSIPDEYNGLSIKWLNKFKEAEREFNRNMDMADFCLKINDLDEAKEYRSKAESNLEIMKLYDNSITNELKSKHKECFIVHIDYLTTLGNISVRTNKVAMYKFHEKLKNETNVFENCYETDDISGFEKYRK